MDGIDGLIFKPVHFFLLTFSLESRTLDIRNGAWLSPVEHLLWEQGAGGSNPFAPTNTNKGL